MNGAMSVGGELQSSLTIDKQLFKTLSQRFRVTWLEQQTATSPLNQFRKRSVLRLHNGNAVGKCFQDIQALGFFVNGWNREHIQLFEKVNLARAFWWAAAKLECITQIAIRFRNTFEESVVALAKISGRQQA